MRKKYQLHMAQNRKQIRGANDEGEILCKQYDYKVFTNAALSH